MAGPYTITPPVYGQPIPPVGFGEAVKNAINDLHTRVAALETGAQAVIARARRTTATGAITTTETGVIRIDNIPVQAGKIYRIGTSNVNMDGSVANDTAACRFRVAFSASLGTVATTASPQIANIRQTMDDITNSNIFPSQCFYLATADGYISILMSAVRTSGTGNLIIFCSGVDILDFVVEYGGTAPADTGVII